MKNDLKRKLQKEENSEQNMTPNGSWASGSSQIDHSKAVPLYPIDGSPSRRLCISIKRIYAHVPRPNEVKDSVLFRLSFKIALFPFL